MPLSTLTLTLAVVLQSLHLPRILRDICAIRVPPRLHLAHHRNSSHDLNIQYVHMPWGRQALKLLLLLPDPQPGSAHHPLRLHVPGRSFTVRMSSESRRGGPRGIVAKIIEVVAKQMLPSEAIP